MSTSGIRSGLTDALEALFTDINTSKRVLVYNVVAAIERHIKIGVEQGARQAVAQVIKCRRPSFEELQKAVTAQHDVVTALVIRIDALESRIFGPIPVSIESLVAEAEKRGYEKGITAAGEYVAKYHMPSLPDLSAWRDGMANTLLEEGGKPHVKR